ncbi:MAG: carbon storage regulator CsrA [Armatimonadota bacterium]
MLVLTRKEDEQVVIADDIVVHVVEIKGNVVRLGFEAPSDIPIHRREVYDEISAENKRAAFVDPEQIRKLTE